MQPGTRAVFTLLEIKAAIEQFESGEESAADTVAKILELCSATEAAGVPKNKAA